MHVSSEHHNVWWVIFGLIYGFYISFDEDNDSQLFWNQKLRVYKLRVDQVKKIKVQQSSLLK